MAGSISNGKRPCVPKGSRRSQVPPTADPQTENVFAPANSQIEAAGPNAWNSWQEVTSDIK